MDKASEREFRVLKRSRTRVVGWGFGPPRSLACFVQGALVRGFGLHPRVARFRVLRWRYLKFWFPVILGTRVLRICALLMPHLNMPKFPIVKILHHAFY